RAGFAKVYIPEAAVIHSHDYSGWEWLRRSFDETRAMHEVYGFDEPGRFGTALAGVRGGVSADVRWSRGRGEARTPLRIASGSLRLHSLRAVGTMLGTRAGRLPDALVRRLSL